MKRLHLTIPADVLEAYTRKAGSPQAAIEYMRHEAMSKLRHNAKTYSGQRARELEQQYIAKQIKEGEA